VDDKGDIMTDNINTEGHRDYYEPEDMDRFLHANNSLELNDKDIENLNRPITSHETES
jgi:hypothetical protein